MTKIWTKLDLEAELGDLSEHALVADGFEKAVIGVGYRPGSNPIVIYDINKCLKVLVDRDKMTPEEAREYFEYNTLGAWVGEGTPIYANMEPPDLI
jgi:hypothetical protein|tara:strand:- start:1004 stop:1291 length:288 start_codon:yes stop_codon:yes gene_type:complete